MSFEFLSRIGLMILFGTILVIHAAFDFFRVHPPAFRAPVKVH